MKNLPLLRSKVVYLTSSLRYGPWGRVENELPPGSVLALPCQITWSSLRPCLPVRVISVNIAITVLVKMGWVQQAVESCSKGRDCAKCRYTIQFCAGPSPVSIYITSKLQSNKGPRWCCGNTLDSHLWGRWFKPRTLRGKVGSCLPVVGSLQCRTLTNCVYWFPLPTKTTRRDMSYTMCWKGCKTPQINKYKAKVTPTQQQVAMYLLESCLLVTSQLLNSQY